MFTPQEVQEQTFVKAVFGGYDMQSVDAFLEPLIQDYVTLYKENSVLKSKMKVLVIKLEEYRSKEDSLNKALANAQRASEKMLEETKRQCEQMKSGNAAAPISDAAQLLEISAAEDKITRARQIAAEYISRVESEIRYQLTALEGLRNAEKDGRPGQAQSRPYDFDTEQDRQDSPREVARQIEESVGKITGEDTSMDATRVIKPASDRFGDLQFGNKYDPLAPSDGR